MRAHYETKYNLRVEDVVASIFARYMRIDQAKIPAKQYRMDRAALCNGRVIGLFEIKERSCAHNQYPNYMLSAAKFRDGQLWAESGLVWFALVVSFLDGIFYYQYETQDVSNIETRLKGRTDRNDAQDIEPVVMIPMYLFEQVELTLPEQIKLLVTKKSKQ